MRKVLVALEPLAVLIAGGIVVRYCYVQPAVYNYPRPELVARTLGAFLVGISMAGGIGLGVESIRRRGKGGVWGVGRWIWALSSASIALLLTLTTIETPLYRTKWLGQPTGFSSLLGFFDNDLTWHLGRICLHLGAFLVARWLVRPQVAEKADAREWTGRVLGGALILWWFLAGLAYLYSFVRLRLH